MSTVLRKELDWLIFCSSWDLHQTILQGNLWSKLYLCIAKTLRFYICKYMYKFIYVYLEPMWICISLLLLRFTEEWAPNLKKQKWKKKHPSVKAARILLVPPLNTMSLIRCIDSVQVKKKPRLLLKSYGLWWFSKSTHPMNFVIIVTSESSQVFWFQVSLCSSETSNAPELKFAGRR